MDPPCLAVADRRSALCHAHRFLQLGHVHRFIREIANAVTAIEERVAVDAAHVVHSGGRRFHGAAAAGRAAPGELALQLRRRLDDFRNRGPMPLPELIELIQRFQRGSRELVGAEAAAVLSEIGDEFLCHLGAEVGARLAQRQALLQAVIVHGDLGLQRHLLDGARDSRTLAEAPRIAAKVAGRGNAHLQAREPHRKKALQD
jgi:hypothetical protein